MKDSKYGIFQEYIRCYRDILIYIKKYEHDSDEITKDRFESKRLKLIDMEENESFIVNILSILEMPSTQDICITSSFPSNILKCTTYNKN
jgi:hypothetical protein